MCSGNSPHTWLFSLQLGQEGKVPLQSAHLYYNVTEKVRRVMESYFRLDTPLYFSYSHLVCRTAIKGGLPWRNRNSPFNYSYNRRGSGIHTVHRSVEENSKTQPSLWGTQCLGPTMCLNGGAHFLLPLCQCSSRGQHSSHTCPMAPRQAHQGPPRM